MLTRNSWLAEIQYNIYFSTDCGTMQHDTWADLFSHQKTADHICWAEKMAIQKNTINNSVSLSVYNCNIRVQFYLILFPLTGMLISLTTHITLRNFYVRIVLVSVGLSTYVQQYATWLKVLMIILYTEETGWLYSSISQLSHTILQPVFSICTQFPLDWNSRTR